MTELVAVARVGVERHARSAALAALGGLAAVVVGAAVARHSAVHEVIASLIVLNVVGLAVRSPRLGVVVTLGFLPFLALTRRLLISYDGWHRTDALLLVAPLVAVVSLALGTSAQPRTALSKCVLGLLAWTALSTLNPLGGSLRANVVGLLFVGAPLLWFFVGRDIVDAATMKKVLTVQLVTSVVVACYGLAQTSGSWTSWDRAWITTAGYQALHVGNTTRAFGTFSSSAEYTSFLAVGIAVAFALFMHRRPYAIVIVPFLAAASFLDGSRGIIVLAIGAVLLQAGLRTRRTALAVAVVAIGIGAAVVGLHTYAPIFAARAASTGNPLVERQVTGLTHPLDTTSSTLPAHWSLFLNGFRGALARPLGLGPGATSLAASRFGGTTNATEVDLSNELAGLGIPGGLLFGAIVLLAWRRALRLYKLRADVVALAAAGVLFVLLGQWLNGGYYAIAPFVWLVIGWLEREAA